MTDEAQPVTPAAPTTPAPVPCAGCAQKDVELNEVAGVLAGLKTDIVLTSMQGQRLASSWDGAMKHVAALLKAHGK